MRFPEPQYCPYCFAQLNLIDTITVYNKLYHPYNIKIWIYKCPNANGFDNHKDAIEYIEDDQNIITDITKLEPDLSKVYCKSGDNKSPGMFHIADDFNFRLIEGYPF